MAYNRNTEWNTLVLNTLELKSEVISRVEKFKYLGPVMQDDWGIEEDTAGQIRCGCMERRGAMGVSCDKNGIQSKRIIV